jgi:hypothetical protein
MRAAFSLTRVIALLPLLVGAAGCGGQYPVRGKATFEDGTPLTTGMVVFERQEGGKAVMARGEIQADGSYQLGTGRPGDGATPGKYQVLVSVPDPIYQDEERPTPPLDPRYMDYRTSGLEFEVKPGPNEYPIRVSRAAGSR